MVFFGNYSTKKRQNTKALLVQLSTGGNDKKDKLLFRLTCRHFVLIFKSKYKYSILLNTFFFLCWYGLLSQYFYFFALLFF